jgi:uncharacterized protein YbbC (DUF1343 family)
MRRRVDVLVRALLLLVCVSCGQESPLGPENPAGRGAAGGDKAGAKPGAPAAVAVQVGLEKLQADSGGALKGKKVGLIAHAASLTSDGRPAQEVLAKAGVNVVRLFAPEHGLKAQLAAGEKVEGGVDAASKLPLVSLYGEKSKPSQEDLKGLDALVFDLQDGGVRFYTYISTLILALEAAGEAGIEFVVLDRPNPLGGERIEGPVSDPRDAVPASLVNTAPGPLVHGLTAGEMARFVNASLAKPARLTVIPMAGWKRTMGWKETGRPWVPPSPNLRSAEAAFVYPGVALLEGTNVSEGRGTDTPFLLIGAPWLKPEVVQPLVSAPGILMEPTTFTPRPSPSAPEPKHSGQACSGFRLTVKDYAARPYRAGVALLQALRTQPGFQWRQDGAALDRLVGTRKLREALEKGETADAIVAADDAAIEAWRKDRQKALLY